MAQVSLLKALTAAGAGSRRTAAQAVKDGRVSLNRATATAFSQPVDPSRDDIRLDGQPLKPPPHSISI
jgi:16S rRNA U516 pseudouridylate synthase RsuA-like enzyme